MKKLLLLFMACLLSIISCGNKVDSADYFNMPGGWTCSYLGDTVYYNAATVRCYNAEFDHVITGFCRDPLCEHNPADGICPESWSFMSKYCITDGSRIYMSTRDTDQRPSPFQLWSFLPDGSDMKLLTEFEMTNNAQLNLSYYDGYIYFLQGYYNDSYDPDNIASDGSDQYTRVRRISTKGGTVKDVLDSNFQINDRFYLDADNYYIVHMPYNFDFDAGQNNEEKRTLDIINRKTGEITENVDLDGGTIDRVIVYRGVTYFLCTMRCEILESHGDPDINTATAKALFIRDGDGFRQLTGEFDGSMPIVVFSDGAAWYSPYKVTYIGSKEMPTGRGNEKELRDWYSRNDGTLVRYDLLDGTVTTYTAPGHADGDALFLYGMSHGYAIVSVSNQQKIFEDVADSAIYKATLNTDGTVTLESEINNE